MHHAAHDTNSNQARILLHSQRNLFGNFHYRLGLYEFEDIIRQVDRVDLISPEAKPWFPYGTRLANRLANTYPIGLNPGVRRIRLQKSYDLFFAVVQFPNDLLHIGCVEGWRKKCKTAICWLHEAWIPEMNGRRYFLRLLRDFDYVIVQLEGSVKRVQEAVSRPCVYMPSGIDTMLFCPYPNAPRRVIDVYSIGRKSENTHRALLRMASDNNMFYVYDTINGNQVVNPNEHRLLFANMAKRSRYFIVNPSKPDEFEETRGQNEFGSRFFEGAAAGAIMIGETPQNDQFKKAFDWTDAVLHLPFGSDNIDTMINELDKDPLRHETVRKTNMVQSLLRHDWVYRWEAILQIAGLQPMPELCERKRHLENLAGLIEREAASKHLELNSIA